MRYFKLYKEGGFRLGVYNFQVRYRRIRGVGFTLEWCPGPWREDTVTHSWLELTILCWRFIVEHSSTYVSLDAANKRE